MKYSISGIIIGLVSLLSSVSAGEWIRINQLGYLPESPKVAVFMSEGKAAVEEYVLVEVFTGEIYNPQNEMFQRFKTKCSFLQNEAYLCKSFFLP